MVGCVRSPLPVALRALVRFCWVYTPPTPTAGGYTPLPLHAAHTRLRCTPTTYYGRCRHYTLHHCLCLPAVLSRTLPRVCPRVCLLAVHYPRRLYTTLVPHLVLGSRTRFGRCPPPPPLLLPALAFYLTTAAALLHALHAPHAVGLFVGGYGSLALQLVVIRIWVTDVIPAVPLPLQDILLFSGS